MDAYPGFLGIAPTLRHRGRNCIIDRATRLFAAMASENVPKCRRLSTGSLASAQIRGLPRGGVEQAGPLSRLAYQPWQGGAALRLCPSEHSTDGVYHCLLLVPCGGARVASRSAAPGWPGSSARCSPASVVAGSPSSRLRSASAVGASSSGRVCPRGRRTSSSARPNHRARFAPGGVPVTTVKRRRIARNGVRDPLCSVRTIEVRAGSAPLRCCRCFCYSG